jgi:hydroxymethylbilane synthase
MPFPLRPLRVGTRGSALGLWQADAVRAKLRAAGVESNRVVIATRGDVSSADGDTRFTAELDRALTDLRIDVAIHAFKDLPAMVTDGLTLAAVGNRDDPRDALVCRKPMTWDRLPREARIGTTSPRRRAQLLRARPDLRIAAVHGHPESRLAQLDRSDTIDALVLASAGLRPLGLEHRISETLDPDLMLPAPGQGCMVALTREADPELSGLVRAALHSPRDASCVLAERGFLSQLTDNRDLPVAAWASWAESGEAASGWLELSGRVLSLDGSRLVEGVISEPVNGETEAENLGIRLADDLMAQGAVEIIDDAIAELEREREG